MNLRKHKSKEIFSYNQLISLNLTFIFIYLSQILLFNYFIKSFLKI